MRKSPSRSKARRMRDFHASIRHHPPGRSATRQNAVAPIQGIGVVAPAYASGCNLNPTFDLDEKRNWVVKNAPRQNSWVDSRPTCNNQVPMPLLWSRLSRRIDQNSRATEKTAMGKCYIGYTRVHPPNRREAAFFIVSRDWAEVLSTKPQLASEVCRYPSLAYASGYD